MEYVLGYNVTSILGNSFLYYLFFFSIFVLIDFFVFHHFVYKGKKYLDYCREFEKESRTTKILWQFLVLLLYIIAIILLALIFFLGHRGESGTELSHGLLLLFSTFPIQTDVYS